MKKNILKVLIFSSMIFLTTGCTTNSNTKENKSSHEKISQNNKEKEEKIDYDDQEHWVFTSGKMQSPIDIVTSKAEKLEKDAGNIVLDYSKDIAKVENNGHSIQVTDAGTSIINSRNFSLTQFHFHLPSEHTVDGKNFPMEVHFVNTAQDGRVAVIGVFFEEGAENKGFQEVLDNIGSEKPDSLTDLDDMLPTSKSYYHYLGSLTTPPLNENVEWYVLKQPVSASKKQIEEFKKLYSHNNREIQPLNGRTIIEHNE